MDDDSSKDTREPPEPPELLEPTDLTDTPEPTEARGPHLPDRWPVLLFVLLAAATAWLSYQETGTTVWTSESLAAFVLGVAPAVFSVLLPGALLLRHPDATTRARTLLFGTLLFAAVPFFRAIEDLLRVPFDTLTPPSDDLGLAPLSIIYNEFQSALMIFGVLYVALGLSRARRWAYTRGARVGGYVILGVAGATAAATIYQYSQVDLSGTEMTPALALWIASSIALAILSVLAWAYLAMATTRASMSGEEPMAGWLVAAAGSCLILLTYAIGAWAGLVQTRDAPLQAAIFWLSTITYSVGYLGLLGGFLLGMPSLEPPDSDDDEPDTEELEGDDSAADDSDDSDDDEDEDEETAA